MKGKINTDRIREASQDIENAVQRLKSLGKMSLEGFLSDEDSKDIARSRLLIAIEAAIHKYMLSYSSQKTKSCPYRI